MLSSSSTFFSLFFPLLSPSHLFVFFPLFHNNKKTNSTPTPTDLMKEIGAKWAAMSEAEKQAYKDKCASEGRTGPQAVAANEAAFAAAHPGAAGPSGGGGGGGSPSTPANGGNSAPSSQEAAEAEARRRRKEEKRRKKEAKKRAAAEAAAGDGEGAHKKHKHSHH